MAELKDIEYKGIGAGLPIPCHRDLWLAKSMVSLSDDDWQMLPHPDTETAKHAKIVEPHTELNEVPQASTIHGDINKQFSQGNLTPLERYCRHVQAHEQLAAGQIPDRKSLTGPNQIDNMLDNAAKLLSGLSPEISASSWSILSLTSSEGQNMTPAPKLDRLLLLAADSSATPQEQAKRLHTIAKLKRRLGAEGSPRQMKPVRVRKRSKGSNESHETLEA
ncbi:hypothetical protein F5X97DRAFT_309372 [Nemania serpens]|nr:hypothetical protein F5X97DRAFT_309372 [Nemania serpens]